MARLLYQHHLRLSPIINYAYSKDISAKVRAVIRLKQEQGDYIGAALPYGYKKQKIGGATKYVVDEQVEEVVKSIFSWAAQGDTGYVIASRLNKQSILSPNEYRKQSPDNTNQKGIWTRNSVMSILRNRVYTGILVMGKTWTNPIQMRKPKRVAKSDWIFSFEHHEPIIDHELFQRIQRILDSRQITIASPKRIPLENIYLGNKLYCGDCGRKMKRRIVRGKTYYICPRYTEAKGACTSKWISMETLLDNIFDFIMLEIEKVIAYCKRQSSYEQSLAFKIKNDFLYERSLQLSNEIDFFDSTVRKRYEVMADNMINGSDYALIRDFIEEQRNADKSELYDILTELDSYQKNISSNCTWIKEFLKFTDADTLTEDMYNRLVDRVLVWDADIEVHFIACYAETKQNSHRLQI